jgi:hypothetical protein
MKAKKIYKAKKYGVVTDRQAQIYGEYLEQLGDTISPKQVVELAKSKNCPFHNYFDWNDKKAGNKHRLHQARMLINSIQVVVIIDNKPQKRKAWFSVKEHIGFNDETARNYASFDRVINDENLREQILNKALSEVRYWREQYKIYSELMPIFKSINVVEQKIRGKTKCKNKNKKR